MSHISTWKINITDLGDVEKVKEKLTQLGYKLTDREINDYYGRVYNRQVAFKVQLSHDRVFGVTKEGQLIGDSYLINDEVTRLMDALTASVVSANLEKQGFVTSIEKKEDGFEVTADEPSQLSMNSLW